MAKQDLTIRIQARILLNLTTPATTQVGGYVSAVFDDRDNDTFECMLGRHSTFMTALPVITLLGYVMGRSPLYCYILTLGTEQDMLDF